MLAAGRRDRVEVKVPLTDLVSGERYEARLACELSDGAHRISMVALRDDSGEAARPAAAARRRIDALLKEVADRRLCGNAALCPSAVVAILGNPQRRHGPH